MARRPLIPLLLTFMAGIFAGHAFQEAIGAFFLPLACAVIALLFLYLFLSPRLRTACILVLFFLCGILLQLDSQRPSKILPLARQHEKVIVEGVLLEPVQVHEKTAKLNVIARTIFFHGKSIPTRAKLLITVYRNAPENLPPGEIIRFPARLRAFKNFKNPGAYDYETAMKIKGFSCAGAVSDGRFIVPRGRGSLPFPYGYLETLRRPLRQFFHQNLAQEDETLFKALILGERQGITPALREPFNRTGLGHLLAVSGLHIGLVSWVAFFLFKWLFTRSYHLTLTINVRKAAALLTCIPVVLYASLAGLQVSCQRAMIMSLVFFGSILLDREKDIWSTLALAAFIILAMEPLALFSIGFQLSFTAVLGILWLAAPLLSRKSALPENQPGLKRLLFRFKRGITGLVIICLAAQIILLPLIVHSFHQVSPVALFANITTIPLLGFWILPAGLVAALLFPLSPFLAAMILHIGATGLHTMMATIRFWSQLPFASFWMVTPDALETVLFYALLFCIFFLRKWHWTRPALMLVSAAILLDTVYWIHDTSFHHKLRVTFLDVGQGNAALVEFPGSKRMVIDGGGFPGSSFDVGRNVVAPFLWHQKITHVDYLVLSHPQADHMKGLVFLAKAFHPKQFWYNGDYSRDAAFSELMNTLASRSINILLPGSLWRGREISGVRIDILHPPPRYTPLVKNSGSRFSLNDRSLVVKLSSHGQSFLFPGDIQQQGEKTLLKNAPGKVRSQVLLSPHHGSSTSNSHEFLAAVAPQVCVISCGGKNRFGFPHPSTLQRLRQRKCRILRTDRDGAIRISVSGKDGKGEIRTYRNRWKPLPLRLAPQTERDGVFTPSLSEDPGAISPGRAHRLCSAALQ